MILWGKKKVSKQVVSTKKTTTNKILKANIVILELLL